MTTKSIDTLVDDIYEVLGADRIELSDALLEHLGADLQTLMKARLTEERGPPRLRMSSLGKPDRQLFYEINQPDGVEKEDLPPQTYLKFMFGDLWELVILFLAEAAGHEVTHKQGEVKLDGIVGHNDAVIDGVVVDVKSASTFAFKKFADGTLPDNDPFGYMEQLAAYCTAYGGLDGAFLAVDKTTGKLALLKFPFEELEAYAIEERVRHLKEVLDQPELPERCYEDIPEGKSGNMALSLNCSYCPFKNTCWQDANGGVGLRTFIYSSGPKYLTKVVKEPKVYEASF